MGWFRVEWSGCCSGVPNNNKTTSQYALVSVLLYDLRDLRRNPSSRGVASAVTVGAEILLDGDDPDGDDWITAADWAENPESLTRVLVPFLKDDNDGRSTRKGRDRRG